ncbi:MAG: cell division ATP-binding protein FtsE [Nitrospiraceae bacterium]|nr:cell division ATP-binding protein FtsE [Nitrospiraceae bacterium]
MVRFENVSKIYDGQEALSGVSFEAGRGELLFITGASGAGKSTLLRLIYRAINADDGAITVNGAAIGGMKGRHVSGLRRQIGVIFQDFRLLSGKTIYDNVALAMRIRGVAEKALKPQVMETLKMVGLRHKADNFPEALSGGEQQRAVIARAVVAEPLLLLADEPTGNLDPETSTGIMRIFKEINARGATVIIATHNRDLYTGSGRRVLRLASGKIEREDIG